jgi:uncharacterized protein
MSELVKPYVFDSGTYALSDLPPACPANVIKQLMDGHFIIEKDINEIETLKKRVGLFTEGAPLSLTIGTTLNCNLRCYYCYEEKSPKYMDKSVCDSILRYVRHMLTKKRTNIYVLWFGGEPMLNQEAIEYLSPNLLFLATEFGVVYKAGIISNGTCWPEDEHAIESFVTRNHISSAQFTLDGIPKTHDRKKFFVAADGTPASSFEAIQKTVLALIGKVKINIRVNCDKENISELNRVVDYLSEAGCLYPGSGVFIYPALIENPSSDCSFALTSQLSNAVFVKSHNEFRRYVAPYIDSDEYYSRIYPNPIDVICTAKNPKGLVIGPDGNTYRCERDIGRVERALANITLLSSASKLHEPSSDLLNTDRYARYSPLDDAECKQCKYLPQCMSGCPRQRLDNAPDVQKEFWENSLKELLTTCVELTNRTRAK